jgi:molybdopterin-guanine dinucleotide biosynthesis protein A
MKKISSEFTGVILAGGKSSRFGKNKALSILKNRPLIEFPASVMTDLFDDLLLVTGTPEEYRFLGWPTTSDIYRDSGPLAGIHAAIKAANRSKIFVSGCDMPFLDKELITYLCEKASGHDAVIPRTVRGLEPLHAVYSRNLLQAIEEALENGIRKIHQFLADANIREVSEAEILAVTGNLDSFRNVNTPEDLSEADA